MPSFNLPRMNANALKLVSLGDVLGSLLYLGGCAECRRQFLSTHDRVAQVQRPYNDPAYPGLTYTITICERCARAAAKSEAA